MTGLDQPVPRPHSDFFTYLFNHEIIMPLKEVAVFGWCLIVYNVWLVVVELPQWRAESPRHDDSYLVNSWCLGLDIALSIFSFTTSVINIIRNNKLYSLGAFQMVWMHVAGRQVSTRLHSYSRD
jgi:uncharacterized membrane protein